MAKKLVDVVDATDLPIGEEAVVEAPLLDKTEIRGLAISDQYIDEDGYVHFIDSNRSGYKIPMSEYIKL